MIFDVRDIMVLNRILIRKGIEVATATFDKGMGEDDRRSYVSELVKHISRAKVMLSLATNDLSNISAELEFLENEGLKPMPSFMDGYLASLKNRDSEDEGEFTWMTDELAFQYPFLRHAADIADTDGWVPTAEDVAVIRSVRHTMRSIVDRCMGQDPDVLGDSLDYAVATGNQCAILLRISGLKSVTSEDISSAVDALGAVDTHDFDRIFLDILGPDERADLEAFRADLGRFIAMMYARCIMNSRLPGSSEISDGPYRSRPSIKHPA